LQNLKDELITVESSETALLDGIKKRKWWQGSLIPASDLSNCLEEDKGVDWWVIATQPCNIYNPDFQKVPVFEVVAACEITECLTRLSKGDDPRVLHLEVQADDEIKALQIDIQNRKWLPRNLLANLSAPKFHIRDTQPNPNIDANWSKKTWLDNFVGWVARSYTRIALPDDFNLALKKSKIEDVFKEKLAKHHDQLYGIYLVVDPDSDDEWLGRLGEMPPPYLLEIMLVTYEDSDPESLKNELIQHLFENKVSDPDDKDKKLIRAELANRYHVRIIKQAISAQTMAGVNLLELKRYVRYSFVDHLSNSSVATGD
jgi:hypothetical protein